MLTNPCIAYILENGKMKNLNIKQRNTNLDFRRICDAENRYDSRGDARRRSKLDRLLVTFLFRLFTKHGKLKLNFSDAVTNIANSDPFDFEISPPSFPQLLRIMVNPNYFVGESFVQNHWSIADSELVGFIKFLQQKRKKSAFSRFVDTLTSFKTPLYHIRQKFNLKMPNKIERHYDERVSFFKEMIGDELIYTCAIFENDTDTLEEAQENKIATIATRLDLAQSNLDVLDVGCGWGGMAFTFAEEFDANVDGITISRTQFDHACKRVNCKTDFASNGVRVFLKSLQEYSSVADKSYDRIFSVGVFEHFGEHNQGSFFDHISEILNPGGLCLMHCVTALEERRPNPWIEKHIFPGHYVQTQENIEKYIKNSGLILRKTYVIEPKHYAKTLHIWRERLLDSFDPESADANSWEDFRRINFYLASCEASFCEATLGLHVCHFVCEKPRA